MKVLARSLLEQSEFFLHVLASAEWYSSKNEDCALTSVLLLTYYYVVSCKSHTLLWLGYTEHLSI